MLLWVIQKRFFQFSSKMIMMQQEIFLRFTLLRMLTNCGTIFQNVTEDSSNIVSQKNGVVIYHLTVNSRRFLCNNTNRKTAISKYSLQTIVFTTNFLLLHDMQSKQTLYFGPYNDNDTIVPPLITACQSIQIETFPMFFPCLVVLQGESLSAPAQW